jgi:peptide/nickel transport system substrate-binding protein
MRWDRLSGTSTCATMMATPEGADLKPRWSISMRVAAFVIAALFAVACESNPTPASASRKPGNLPKKVRAPKPRNGGVMWLASIGDVDYMDPGQAYSVIFSSTVGRATLRTLISYPGTPLLDKQVVPAPDLATALGEHNADNTHFTYHLRPGLEYGKALGGVRVPGVTGRPIKTSDIKYAIERLYNPAVGAGYSFYYDNLIGAARCKRAARFGCQISGIQTPDDNTIVFNLTRPTGDWDMRMALPATAPVPRSVASKYDRRKDSTYDSHVVSSGPYYVAEYRPGEAITMKRNSNWHRSSDPIRKSYADRIEWREGFDNSVCNAKVAAGNYAFAVDCMPAGSQLRSMSGLGARFFNGPELCTRYIYMNTRVKPFDNIKVRQAVNFVVDRFQQRQAAGGPLMGQIATSVLPPGMLGHLPIFAYDPFPPIHARRDETKAKALMKDAGYPNGWYRKLLLYTGPSTSLGSLRPRPKQVEALRADLRKIGIDHVKVEQTGGTFPGGSLYSLEPLPKTALGFAGWCADFPSPSSFLVPLLYGPSNRPTVSSNYSHLNDASLNSLIRKAEAASYGDADAAWAAANKRATELAPWVPLLWSFSRVVVSPHTVAPFYQQLYQKIDIVNAGVNGTKG